jgi:hypothetical protein
VICLAPRAPGASVHPRLQSGVVVRPLNFTVRRVMKRSLLLVCLVALTPASGANDGVFAFDRQLAIELAVSYVKSYFRKWPSAALPDMDYQHPDLIAVRDIKHRQLVFVSFASTKSGSPWGHWGAVASFQLCKEPPVLRLVEISTVGSIESEREDTAKIDAHTHVHLEDACPKTVE